MKNKITISYNMEKAAERLSKDLLTHITKEDARALFHQKSFESAANNIINNFIHDCLDATPQKNFSNKAAELRRTTGADTIDYKTDLEKIIKEKYSKDVISEFENEFNDRLVLFDKNLPRKLKKKNLYKKLFSSWMFSLCTISSMPYVDDDSGMKQFSIFQ